jgi:hypothetical protein
MIFEKFEYKKRMILRIILTTMRATMRKKKRRKKRKRSFGMTKDRRIANPAINIIPINIKVRARMTKPIHTHPMNLTYNLAQRGVEPHRHLDERAKPATLLLTNGTPHRV